MAVSRGSEWNRWDLHVHTASSYDYNYKANDADQLLCDNLIKNNIRAVAITDHFMIDKNRIEKLRSIAPQIVFFPGVELRTDKGGSNVHVILIFSEKADLDTLSIDFDAIMRRGKAKSAESNETIYWVFEDIVEFASQHNALLSIHAGRKTNGIDKEITNALQVNQAIKKDIADRIHFFEIGQVKDIESYNHHVFKEIERKPLIICSDNHNPNKYEPKESLWIKADCTFEGLKQCLYQPLERVYIGPVPPILDRLNKNKQANIDKVLLKRIESPANDTMHWFDSEIPLNPGMTAIIGNKGTGKSALSDVIGHLCKCSTMKYASFLNVTRFRKLPKNYSKDYTGTVVWADGETSTSLLSQEQYDSTIEDAQYLPQKYIEDVCNDIDNGFQREIDRVIFSYVDRSERGDAQNLDELVQKKSQPLVYKMQTDYMQLQTINAKIIKLESKLTDSYKNSIIDRLKKTQDTLERHNRSKPSEKKKPAEKDENAEYQAKIKELNDRIDQKTLEIQNVSAQISSINELINESKTLLAKIDYLELKYMSVEESVKAFISKHRLEEASVEISLKTPKEYISEVLERAETKKEKLIDILSNSDTGLNSEVRHLKIEKQNLISSADEEEKIYQKYLSDLEEWNKRRAEIIGDKNTDDTLEYYSSELDYIQNVLNDDYSAAIESRNEITKAILADKAELVSIYQSIYAPIQGEIKALLGNIEDRITFEAELFLCNPNTADEALSYIDRRMKGVFGGSKETSRHHIDKLIQSTDFNSPESVLLFTKSISEAATENLEQADKKISDRQGFYDYVYGLSYIGVTFKLKMGDRNLDELSPGERGIVLLIFYLALSKESKPIIIDQPEDNLDNQSVFRKLVPCICTAKQRRQVIIVTHNPNIAVACDAEQIIYCEMDKNTCQIRYTAGAIENPEIRKHVVDVLEGTKPAFDLRKRKYE